MNGANVHRSLFVYRLTLLIDLNYFADICEFWCETYAMKVIDSSPRLKRPDRELRGTGASRAAIWLGLLDITAYTA